MLIKTFLELAIGQDYQNSLYFKSLYEWYILDNNTITSPRCPPFYDLEFFDIIKTARLDNCVDNWSSKQWYSYLLERKVLNHEIEDDNGRLNWEPIKCQVELAYPDFDWITTWARVRMPGLTNEVRSTFWKLYHNLLPTQFRLSRITRTTDSPTCVKCDTGEDDQAWTHTFLSCPATKPIMDWLVVILERLLIEDVSLPMALWLQFPPIIEECDLLAAVWLVGETISYTWARRRNREVISIPTLTALLSIQAHQLAKSQKHYTAGKKICELLNI